MTVTLEHAPGTTLAPADEAPRARRGLAVVLGALALGFGAWAAVSAGDADPADPGIQAVRVALVVAWALTGLLVAFRRPAEPLGLLVSGAAAVAGLATASAAALLDGSGGTALELARALSVALLPAAAM